MAKVLQLPILRHELIKSQFAARARSIVIIAVSSVCSQALSALLAAVTGLPRRPEEDRELVKNLGVRFGGV